MSGSLMTSVSGIRGLVGEGMNPEVAARFVAAFASRLGEGAVVVGRDTRASGKHLAPVVRSTLQFLGRDTVDLGVAATPTVEIMVTELGAAGGVVITASHNGPEWNALKLLRADGEFLASDEMDEVVRLAAGGAALFQAPKRFGAGSENGHGDDIHIEGILGLDVIDPSRIAEADLTAVVDCVNGAGSRIVPRLLERLGVRCVELFTDVEAPFPHVPEPRPEHLGELSARVRDEHADLGFACDPDADRLVLVDGGGKVCSEEATLALAADFVLARVVGPVVANVSTSRYIDHVARSHGVPVHRSRVGEVNVIELMKETGAVVGGEGNGGVILPALHYGRDAMVGMALVLQSLAEKGARLEDLVSALPALSIVKEKTAFDGELGQAYPALAEAFGGKADTIDGLRIEVEAGWTGVDGSGIGAGGGWIHVRKSNTEPVVRIIAEAGSEAEANLLVVTARRLIEAARVPEPDRPA